MKRFCACVLAVVVLAGCGDPPKRGVVVNRYHWEASDDGVGQFHVVGDVIHHQPAYKGNPESWGLKIQDSSRVERIVRVSKRTFDSAKIGDRYDNGKIIPMPDRTAGK